jgi:hypothetical protein
MDNVCVALKTIFFLENVFPLPRKKLSPYGTGLLSFEHKSFVIKCVCFASKIISVYGMFLLPFKIIYLL